MLVSPPMQSASRPEGRNGAGSFLRAVVAILTSVAASRGLALAKGLIVAGLLSPTDYGVATLVAVVVAYSSFADLGTSTAACRDLSLAVGRGDRDAAGTAKRHLLALRVCGGLVAGGAAFFASWWSAESPARLGLRWAFPVAVASSAVTAALLRWQAEGKTRHLAAGTLVHALLDAVLAIVLTRLFGLRGLIGALFAAPVLAAAWACGRGVRHPPLARERIPSRLPPGGPAVVGAGPGRAQPRVR